MDDNFGHNLAEAISRLAVPLWEASTKEVLRRQVIASRVRKAQKPHSRWRFWRRLRRWPLRNQKETAS